MAGRNFTLVLALLLSTLSMTVVAQNSDVTVQITGSGGMANFSPCSAGCQWSTGVNQGIEAAGDAMISSEQPDYLPGPGSPLSNGTLARMNHAAAMANAFAAFTPSRLLSGVPGVEPLGGRYGVATMPLATGRAIEHLLMDPPSHYAGGRELNIAMVPPILPGELGGPSSGFDLVLEPQNHRWYSGLPDASVTIKFPGRSSGIGEISGWLEGDTAVLDLQYIDKPIENMGFGSQALRQWEQGLPASVKQVRLSSTPEAHGYWLKMGFKDTYSLPTRGGTEMIKRIR